MRTKAQIYLHFLLRFRFLPQLLIDSRHRHMRFRVAGIQPDGFLQLCNRGIQASQRFEYGTQLKMGLGKFRIDAEGFTQICLCVRYLIHKLLRNSQVEVRPRRRMWRSCGA